jgi:hypothetical protein
MNADKTFSKELFYLRSSAFICGHMCFRAAALQPADELK